MCVRRMLSTCAKKEQKRTNQKRKHSRSTSLKFCLVLPSSSFLGFYSYSESLSPSQNGREQSSGVVMRIFPKLCMYMFFSFPHQPLLLRSPFFCLFTKSIYCLINLNPAAACRATCRTPTTSCLTLQRRVDSRTCNFTCHVRVPLQEFPSFLLCRGGGCIGGILRVLAQHNAIKNGVDNHTGPCNLARDTQTKTKNTDKDQETRTTLSVVEETKVGGNVLGDLPQIEFEAAEEAGKSSVFASCVCAYVYVSR